MDDDLAALIVERYNAALLETSSMTSGIPESRLPCDQSLVKEAIKLVLTRTSKFSEDYFDLQNAYSKLGMFIPDSEAEMVRLAEEAISVMDPMHEGFKYLNRHAEIQKRIQDSMYLLTEELNEFVSQQGDQCETYM